MKTNEVILIRYGEIYLKGKNRGFFEKTLLNNIKNVLKDINVTIKKISGRYTISDYEEEYSNEIINRLKKIFGIYSISPAIQIDTNEKDIEEYIKTIKIGSGTFKVDVNRADKTFNIKSIEFASKLGGIILENNNNVKVDLHNPNTVVHVDIRENGKTYIFYKIIKCVNGMPVGTSGRGLLMLSGGIDSPVAGYYLAHRGMSLSAIHFQSYPYTSVQAKEKVFKLAKLMSEYTGDMKIYVVSFTHIQEEIHKHCDPDYMITIMRRFMFSIAEKIALKNNLQAIITGENLAQVASQTVESMTTSNACVKSMPIFRPLIGFDKDQIIEISQKIGTYDTSILPYEDCCTVFLPAHPVIKPKLEKVEREEQKLDVATLIQEAIDNVEIINTIDMN